MADNIIETISGIPGFFLPSGRFCPIIAGGDGTEGAGAGDGNGTGTGTGDQKTGDQKTGDTKTNDKTGDQGSGEEWDKERGMATIKKLREFEKTGKAAIKKLEELEASQKAADEEKLKKQGEWEQLHAQEKKRADENEAFKAKAEKAEALLKKMLEKECEGLPKHILTLLDKMDPIEQMEYIAENREALGTKSNPPNVNAKDGGQSKDGAMTDVQKKELAAIYGVKPEYIK